jgi:hypothetical protein
MPARCGPTHRIAPVAPNTQRRRTPKHPVRSRRRIAMQTRRDPTTAARNAAVLMGRTRRRQDRLGDIIRRYGEAVRAAVAIYRPTLPTLRTPYKIPAYASSSTPPLSGIPKTRRLADDNSTTRITRTDPSPAHRAPSRHDRHRPALPGAHTGSALNHLRDPTTPTPRDQRLTDPSARAHRRSLQPPVHQLCRSRTPHRHADRQHRPNTPPSFALPPPPLRHQRPLAPLRGRSVRPSRRHTGFLMARRTTRARRPATSQEIEGSTMGRCRR